MTRARLAWLAVGLALAAVAAGPARASAQAPVTVPTVGGDVTILADRLERIGPALLLATGNVEITRGTARLLADRVELNRDTGDTVAEGRVIFYDGEDRLTGRRIEYNVKSGTGVVYDGEAHASPYYRIGGERMERLDASRYRIRRGIFTTCEADPPAWSFHFLSGHADLEELIWGTGGSFWVKNIPLIPFIPFFAAPVKRERQSGFLFPRFGNSSSRGNYVEIPYFWAISDSQDMTITPSFFEERGVGGSLEYRYLLSATNRGEVSGFYLNEMFRDEPRGDGADRNRGWASIKHDWTIAPGLGFRADVNGVTDDLVFRDYGDPLPQRSAQRVESNVFVTKSWPTWNLVGNLFFYQDLTTRRPVELNRLPEIRLDGVRQPLPGVPGVLYEVQSSATYFVRDVGSDGGRLDVRPRVSRPTSVLGFFTVSPFVGGRATGYDTTVTGTRVTREGFTVEETEDEARLRSLLELGTDVEARAARIFFWDGFGGIDAVLHSIEPRVNYTWIDGSNLTRLPQWTSGIDDVRRASLTSYSLTNRLRARTVAPEGTEPQRWELMRFVLGHSYDFKNADRPLGDVTGDLIVDPNRVLHFRGTTSLSSYGEGFQTGTTDLSVRVPRVTTSIGTRFDKPSDVNFLQGGLTAEVTRRLVGRLSTNWDIDEDVFVENRFAVDLKWQCWAFTVELVQRHQDEDELRFALNLLGLGAPLTTSTGVGALTGARSGVR